MPSTPEAGGLTRRTVLKLGGMGAGMMFVPGMWQYGHAAPASLSPVPAEINIDTANPIAIQKGLVGYNLHCTNLAYNFTDDEYRAMVAELQPRYGRYSAGTANNVFDPRTMTMPEERRTQQWEERIHYWGYDLERRIVVGKNDGFHDLVAYYDTLRETCAVLTIVVNAVSGTPDEVEDVVRFCQVNNIIVDYWELQNEPYLLTGGTALPKFYNSALDALAKLKPYNDAIKGLDPNAKTVVAYSTTGEKNWDAAIFSVTAPWWDAIVWHSYEATDPSGSSFGQAMKNGNWLTAEYRRRINSGYLANSRLSPTPILQNELDVKIRGPLYNSQYNAVFNAESVMRLSTAPKDNTIMLTGAGGIPLWILDAANDYTDHVLDAAERDTTLDTNTLDHSLYWRTIGVANVIVNEAINNSASRWDAAITGSATVDAISASGTPSTVDALYATAYQGGLGGGTKNYLLVTNKSDQPHTVAVKLAGTTLATAVTATYCSSEDPTASNTPAAPTLIAQQTDNYADGSGVSIPPYSVVRLEWARAVPVVPPRTPRITSARVASSTGAELKWWTVPHATSYTVHYGTAPGVYGMTQASASSSATISGLTAGGTYYFAVTATGSGGTTPKSNEVSVTTQAPATPTNVVAVGRRSGVATVTWQPAARAYGYRVVYGTAPGSLTTTVEAGNRMGVDIKGLTSGTTYYFAVVAYNGAGVSSHSSTVTAVPVLNLPHSPCSLRLSAPNSATTASLIWDVSLVRAETHTFESGSAAKWTVTTGTWSVIDHPDVNRATKVYASGSSSVLCETATGDIGWGDIAIECLVEVTSFNATGTVSVLLRYTDADNWYRFVYDHGVETFKLIRSVNGAKTTLAQITRANAVATRIPPFSTLDVTHMRMIFEAIGGELKCYVNNFVILEAQDSSHSSGRIAIASNRQIASFDKLLVWVDNMTGTAGTYNLYRSQSPLSGYVQLVTGLTSRSYVDNTLSGGKKYYYKVTAVKGGIESLGISNVLSVAT